MWTNSLLFEMSVETAWYGSHKSWIRVLRPSAERILALNCLALIACNEWLMLLHDGEKEGNQIQTTYLK